MTQATIGEVAERASKVDTSTTDAASERAFVKQWFSGEIEASYYGVPSRVPATSSDRVGHRYRLHIYRAAVLHAKSIDAPIDSESAERQAGDLFFQDAIEIAQLWGVRGPGTRYEGPIHDVTITQPKSRFHTVKDNKSYGTLRGVAQGWMYLPQNVAPEPPQIDQSKQVELPTGVLIQESPQQSVVGDTATRSVVSEIESEPTLDVSIDDIDNKAPKRKTPAQKIEPPYFSLCAAIGLLLWFTCGAEQTWIWCLFMLPTLGMRRLVLEVLPDERGVQAFAAVMVLGAVLSAGTIVASFGSEQCWTLETAPLIVLVGSVFLSGIVPYRIPLAITALTFAGVLFMWGHAPEKHCAADTSIESLPTVKDPGVPRTNEDGTWPRRVTSTEEASAEK